MVYSRSNSDCSTIRSISKRENIDIRVIPDLGFIMQPEDLPADVIARFTSLRSNRKLVGVNISGLLYRWWNYQRNKFDLRESYEELVEALLRRLSLEHDAYVVLIPHVCGGPQSEEDETRLCRRLCDQYSELTGGRITVVEAVLNHRQTKALIGFCDLFIGSRMHACIAAVSHGIPTLCLAYSKKFEGVMGLVSTAIQIVDLRRSTISDVLQAVDHAWISLTDIRKILQQDVTKTIRSELFSFSCGFTKMSNSSRLRG